MFIQKIASNYQQPIFYLHSCWLSDSMSYYKFDKAVVVANYYTNYMGHVDKNVNNCLSIQYADIFLDMDTSQDWTIEYCGKNCEVILGSPSNIATPQQPTISFTVPTIDSFFNKRIITIAKKDNTIYTYCNGNLAYTSYVFGDFEPYIRLLIDSSKNGSSTFDSFIEWLKVFNFAKIGEFVPEPSRPEKPFCFTQITGDVNLTNLEIDNSVYRITQTGDFELVFNNVEEIPTHFFVNNSSFLRYGFDGTDWVNYVEGVQYEQYKVSGYGVRNQVVGAALLNQTYEPVFPAFDTINIANVTFTGTQMRINGITQPNHVMYPGLTNINNNDYVGVYQASDPNIYINFDKQYTINKIYFQVNGTWQTNITVSYKNDIGEYVEIINGITDDVTNKYITTVEGNWTTDSLRITDSAHTYYIRSLYLYQNGRILNGTV